jgi:hypothetical protein
MYRVWLLLAHDVVVTNYASKNYDVPSLNG